ncbi:MAG: BamA/TamA family outer membrane protein [Chlorobi bacterium]|nr:BamA/TamA family outer membrane protein [Chlorobiota bacterium]
MKRNNLHIIMLLLLSTVLTLPLKAQKIFYAHSSEKPEITSVRDTSELLYTVFLAGDIKSSVEGRQNLQILKKYIDKAGKNSAVVVLGDLAYHLGLPDSSVKYFKVAVDDLERLVNTFKDYNGKVYFIPGNHDWANGRRQGEESVMNEEQFIESHLNRGNVYLPDDGCPGPVEIELTSDITLIIFDSQWWFQKYKKPEGDDNCGFSRYGEIFIHLEDALRRNRDKKVIFATHHPLFSVGKHGGYFPASRLLFPLLDMNSKLYIPLPGFIYTGYRKYLGTIQDFAHPEYKSFRNTMLNILDKYPDVIYAAGHEHNMQYVHKNGFHHIISGGGGKASYIAKKKDKADFACQCSGFNRLSFYADGKVITEFIKTFPDTTGIIVFRKELFKKPVFDTLKIKKQLQHPDYTDSTVIEKINGMYAEAGKMRRALLGNNYRNIWNTPVEFPVFDIGTEKGGLKILKRGGGMQTHSVRMENKDKKQYVLRSVNKYVDNALPEYLRNTIAEKPVQDAISASNPYGAITVPPLADAIGVFHTNPKMFWVPDDPRLGIYRDDLANEVFLFEERPDDNREDVASFGRSKKIVSTAKTIKKIHEDHHHNVDQQEVVKARLLDMLLNDWDRHDDQWRWASFKHKGVTTYKPIPRDRDQVYFVNEGFIMWLASRKWLMPKFQGFDYTIENVAGLGFNARFFDRTFMTEPDLNDWLKTADYIKNNITDSVIHEAIKRFPPEVYDSIGNNIEAKLKVRRDSLPYYAEEYYRFLAKGVDVVGTDKKELFDVKRKNNGNTEVNVYALSGKTGKIKKRLFHREFKPDETKEIRLYGLKDDDTFRITGSGKKGIKVRIIGGKGEDSIIDSSKVAGISKKTVVYDRKDKKNSIIKSGETKLKLSKNKAVNDYDRKQFRYDKTIPLVTGGYNIDDGIFIGGGVKIKHFNFRDSTIQKITGDLSLRTGAFDVKYEALFSGVFEPFDLYLNTDISFPRSTDNFYGFGNETPKLTDNKNFYRVRYEYANINPMLKHSFNNNIYYGFGPLYQYFNVTDTAGRYIGELYPDVLDSAAYESHHYMGANILLDIDTRDNSSIPHKGIHWKTELSGYYSLKEDGKDFIKLRSELSFYLSFRKDPRVVFALRAGGAMNFGDYEFYYANFIGGKTNLRGFRSNRFAGDNSFYQNTEIRYKITNVNSYYLTGSFGLLLFNDIGRVWIDNEDSEKWHDGYGAGLWLTPFNLTVITLNYNRSEEDNLVTFSFSYLF